MAARGYLLLLGCILANVPLDDTKLGGGVSCEEDAKRLQGDFDRLELARLPEGSVISEAGHQQQPSQVSIIESRTEHPPRLHGGRPKKVPPFREAEQQQYNPMQLRRRRRGSRILYPVGDEEVIIDEDAMAGHKEFYLPRPPSRMHPHFYEDLQDEKIRQADKHHTNTGHAHHHAHNHKVIEPVIEHNNYWIVGQRRFRMIIIIILAVIVGIIILLILAWFFCPRKFVKKIRSKK
uniref:uncharacterized protein isoform X7 n=1 Tax=Pristiophorus japonicus TaxID=55135 RepID=UPI00398EEF0E